MAYNVNVTATTCDGNSQLIILPGDVGFDESKIYQLPNVIRNHTALNLVPLLSLK